MNASAYNPTAAALLAECSRLAYVRSAQSFGADAAALGLTDVRRFNEPHTDTQGFTASFQLSAFSSRPCLLVCFRGSESAQDWITDLTAKQTAWRNTQRVHAGFYAAHVAAWPMACRDLLALIAAHPESPVCFTGHSLGGALALLAARDMVEARPGLASRTSVITFGAPRVGNRAWSRAYDRLLRDRTFRLVNEEDPVPRVPFALRGFQHVGHEIFFAHLGQRITEPPLWFKLISDAFGVWKDWRRGRLAIATDHCMSHYARLTRRDAEEQN
ncbi:MAG: lipase class 3 [Limisphaerales bacterium]|nr:MAG: lipase class 3 [Limisphaerales bacterium]KAG0508106.1 MAG: lipase class 3 [Limisphaerales bacterium]TXT53041.1 MAG: lipase class 3 [Limisphaerales bacterium]